MFESAMEVFYSVPQLLSCDGNRDMFNLSSRKRKFGEKTFLREFLPPRLKIVIRHNFGGLVVILLPISASFSIKPLITLKTLREFGTPQWSPLPFNLLSATFRGYLLIKLLLFRQTILSAFSCLFLSGAFQGKVQTQITNCDQGAFDKNKKIILMLHF